MKKLALLITCLLTISAAGFAGCNMSNPESDAARNRISDFVQDVIPQTENDDNTDGENDCKDGSCEKENHNFRLTKPLPRTPHLRGNEGRTVDGNEDTDNGDDEQLPPPDARKPRRKHGHGAPVPLPKPLPEQPEN